MQDLKGKTMNLYYEDEYGVVFPNITTAIAPERGDTVIIDDEIYIVKSKIFYLSLNYAVVVLTETTAKPPKQEDSNSGRLNEMRNAIVALSKRQDDSDKTHLTLNEKISSVKKHINQRIQQEKRDTK